MGLKYSHLNRDRRVLIEHLSAQGLCAPRIAEQLGVDRTTVWRELRRGFHRPMGRYVAEFGQRAHDAGRKAAGRCRRKLGSDLSSPAWQPIISGLQAGWSPQQIAGRSRWLDHLLSFAPLARVHPSHETIYKAIFDLPHSPQRAQLTRLLRNSQGGRRRSRARKARFTGIQNITSIEQRPAQVLLRQEPGHWEGDIIKGAGGKSFVGTLVERTSRLTLLLHLKSGAAEEFARAVVARMSDLPAHLRQSLTYDRGTEMARHQDITAALNMPVYFCNPYSPWQRPTNENTNGLLRQYLARGTDLSLHSRDKLLAIEAALNDRPRAVHGWRTAREVFTGLAQGAGP